MNALSVPAVEPQPKRRSRTLVIAGALLLLAALLRANPFFGSANTAWPWEILLEGRSPTISANWTLWLGAGVLAIVLGAWGSDRWRGALLGAPMLVLLFTCYSGQAGLVIDQNSVPVLAGMSLLLAGFLLQSTGRAPAAAIALSAVGGLLAIWALACAFDYKSTGAPRSQLVVLVQDMLSRLSGGDVTQGRLNYDDDLLSYGALLAAAVLGVLSVLRVRGSLIGRIGFVLALLSFVIRPAGAYARALSIEGFEAVTLAKHASAILIPAGLALAFLGAAVLADLARATEERT